MPDNKLCLGIESTAHTFGVGISKENGEILSNVWDTYKPKIGGLDPKECKLHHEKIKEEVLERALEQAKINLEDIDIIAYSAGPGLAPALLVGLRFVKEISKKTNKKLIPVNHCIAHIEIGKLCSNFRDPIFCYVSGGNTQIIAFSSGRYRVFGETQDIAIGNVLDKFARKAGIPHPGGPKIMELAKKSNKYIELPYVVKGMDVSFSGICTKAIEILENKKASLEDLSFSLQETCFAMLVEITERALAHTEKKEVLLAGGVAANKRLQEMMKIMCEQRVNKCKFAVVPLEFAGDNGAMIAWSGILQHKSKETKTPIDVFPKWRIDEIDIDWIK
jgi:universal protein Kae1